MRTLTLTFIVMIDVEQKKEHVEGFEESEINRIWVPKGSSSVSDIYLCGIKCSLRVY